MAKIAFIQEGIYENLGIMQLSAVLKKGDHDVLLLIDSMEKNVLASLKEFRPDIIAFSVITGSHLRVYENIKKIKAILPQALYILGGPHPTFFPEAIDRSGADIICRGEAEGAILDLADAWPDMAKIKTIPNLWVKEGSQLFKNEPRPLVEELDSLPFPDRELYYKYPVLRFAARKTFLTTRGCPYNCSFCFNHQYRKLYLGKGRQIRMRSPQNIIDEILAVKKKYGLASVFFQDDTFILDKNWLKNLLSEYKKQVDLPFTCLVRADLTDEETARQLKEAGCVGVQFGIESGNEAIRNKILRKNLTDEHIIKAAAFYKKYGIKFKTYNILGLPGETLEDAFKTMELNALIRTDLPWSSILTPYPKTDIAEMMSAQGLLPADYGVDDIASSFFDKKTATKHEKNILNLQRLFFWGVKIPRMLPLIKMLVKLPPNFIFNGLFYAGQLYTYKVSENLDWLTSIKMGLNFVRLNFSKK